MLIRSGTESSHYVPEVGFAEDGPALSRRRPAADGGLPDGRSWYDHHKLEEVTVAGRKHQILAEKPTQTITKRYRTRTTVPGRRQAADDDLQPFNEIQYAMLTGDHRARPDVVSYSSREHELTDQELDQATWRREPLAHDRRRISSAGAALQQRDYAQGMINRAPTTGIEYTPEEQARLHASQRQDDPTPARSRAIEKIMSDFAYKEGKLDRKSARLYNRNEVARYYPDASEGGFSNVAHERGGMMRVTDHEDMFVPVSNKLRDDAASSARNRPGQAHQRLVRASKRSSARTRRHDEVARASAGEEAYGERGRIRHSERPMSRKGDKVVFSDMVANTGRDSISTPQQQNWKQSRSLRDGDIRALYQVLSDFVPGDGVQARDGVFSRQALSEDMRTTITGRHVGVDPGSSIYGEPHQARSFARARALADASKRAGYAVDRHMVRNLASMLGGHAVSNREFRSGRALLDASRRAVLGTTEPQRTSELLGDAHQERPRGSSRALQDHRTHDLQGRESARRQDQTAEATAHPSSMRDTRRRKDSDQRAMYRTPDGDMRSSISDRYSIQHDVSGSRNTRVGRNQDAKSIKFSLGGGRNERYDDDRISSRSAGPGSRVASRRLRDGDADAWPGAIVDYTRRSSLTDILGELETSRGQRVMERPLRDTSRGVHSELGAPNRGEGVHEDASRSNRFGRRVRPEREGVAIQHRRGDVYTGGSESRSKISSRRLRQEQSFSTANRTGDRVGEGGQEVSPASHLDMRGLSRAEKLAKVDEIARLVADGVISQQQIPDWLSAVQDGIHEDGRELRSTRKAKQVRICQDLSNADSHTAMERVQRNRLNEHQRRASPNQASNLGYVSDGTASVSELSEDDEA